ncbi:unnamed protein product [Lota lota]
MWSLKKRRRNRSTPGSSRSPNLQPENRGLCSAPRSPQPTLDVTYVPAHCGPVLRSTFTQLFSSSADFIPGRWSTATNRKSEVEQKPVDVCQAAQHCSERMGRWGSSLRMNRSSRMARATLLAFAAVD